MGSSDNLNRSADFGQQYNQNNGHSIKPYDNNPPLPNTQRYDDFQFTK